MPDIALARPLNLTLDSGQRVSFAAGFHRGVEAEVADHWYTKLHLVPDNDRRTAEALAPASTADGRATDLVGRLKIADARAASLAEEVQRVTALWTDAHTRAERLDADLAAEKAATAGAAGLADEVQRLSAELATERTAHAETMRLAAAATAPAGSPASGASGHQDGAHPEAEFVGKPFGLKRRYQGKFAVVEAATDKIVADNLSKADAVAKARELNAKV